MEILKQLLKALPLNKIKLYLTIAGVLFIIGLLINLSVVKNKNAELTANNERILRNQLQLTGDNRQLQNFVFRQNEVNGKLKLQVDSLAKELKVKPKFITRIEYRYITQHDTDSVFIEVNKLSKDTWSVQDSGQCWSWLGTAYLKNSDLEITRRDFQYSNKVTDVFYRKRPEGFFGFLKRRINYHKVTPECGTVQETTFEFIK